MKLQKTLILIMFANLTFLIQGTQQRPLGSQHKNIVATLRKMQSNQAYTANTSAKDWRMEQFDQKTKQAALRELQKSSKK